MAWGFLVIAGIFEIIWAISLKQVAATPSAMLWLRIAVAATLSLVFLAAAMRTLPISIAYPLWVGFGILGTVMAGLILFNEQLGGLKITGLVLLLAGMTLLKAAD